jgi:hypothetical protein
MLRLRRALRVACACVLALAATSAVALPRSSGKPFESSDIVLYQPDAELKSRMGHDAAPLADYIRRLSTAAESIVAEAPPSAGATAAIVVVVKPGRRSRVWLVLGGNELPDAVKRRLVPALEAIRPLPVRDGPVAFAMTFHAWGGGIPIVDPEMPAPIPPEWQEASAAIGGGMLDAIIEQAWPDPASSADGR